MIDERLLPDWINLDVWHDYRDHRRAMRKKMTELAEKYFLRELQKLHKEGHDVNELMCTSIANGWSCLVRPKTGGSNGYKTQADRAAENIAAAWAEAAGDSGTDQTGSEIPKLSIV